MTKTKRTVVCVQGLGFVGAAMATAIAIAKDQDGVPIYEVIGIDLPTESGKARINAINQGGFPFNTNDQKLIAAVAIAHSQGNLSATTDTNAYAQADIVVIDIQLDIAYLDDEPQLLFTGFINALRAVGEKIKEGVLVIVETTVPPGTCEKIVFPTLCEELERRNISSDELKLAHSYERVMPGDDYLSSITDYWRVYAGHTEQGAVACEAFLSSVVNVRQYPLTKLSSTTASETAKVLENTYRATNIAFIDEWTKYAEKVGIDLFEVIDAIRKRPTHSDIRFPGLGVGGYCLTKDLTFTPAAAKQLFGLNLQFPFSQLAVQTNNKMPMHAVVILKEMFAGSLYGKFILICGVSYRQDVGDTRYSPSEILVAKLLSEGAVVEVHDPYVNDWPELKLKPIQELPSSKLYEGVIFAVPHKHYRELNLAQWAVSNTGIMVLDANNVFTSTQRQSARNVGIRLESIGRGRGL